MKTSVTLIDKLISLSKGECLSFSSLKGEWFEQMRVDGILIVNTKGSRKSLRAQDEKSFRNYLAAHFGINDLEAYRKLLLKEDASRAEQVKIVGDSKVMRHRTFRGFLVNCYNPIPIKLAGRSVTLLPEAGTFVFIYDFKTFSLPEDIIIVGVENVENFRYIQEQKWLFESCLSKEARLLFVSRYPQEQSRDLMDWLLSIPNKYVHFGDFDLAGIHIYLSEYYRHLGQRASFLISEDFEKRISEGSRDRYTCQYSKFGEMEIIDHRLKFLVDCIHKYHRGYDQEGFIVEHMKTF